jgi:hypothetical protein
VAPSDLTRAELLAELAEHLRGFTRGFIEQQFALEAALSFARRLRWLAANEDDDLEELERLRQLSQGSIEILQGRDIERDIALTGPGGVVVYLSDATGSHKLVVPVLEAVVRLTESKLWAATATPEQLAYEERRLESVIRDDARRARRYKTSPTDALIRQVRVAATRRGSSRERRPNARRGLARAGASRDGPSRDDPPPDADPLNAAPPSQERAA